MLALESKEEIVTHISSNPKIYKPKPKKLCNSYMPHTNIKPKTFNKKHAFTQIINYNFNFDIKVDICKDMKLKKEISHINKRPKLQIEKISFQEMADDFSKLRERNENKKAEEELLYLLRNSTKDNSQDENNEETIKVKRPKHPFLENVE